MKEKIVFALFLILAVTLVVLEVLHGPSHRPERFSVDLPPAIGSGPAESVSEPEPPKGSAALAEMQPEGDRTPPIPDTERAEPSTNKLERLEAIRTAFRSLAGGDPNTALRAAKQLTDEMERETALLALVTQWTGGALRPARERAQWIAGLGLEVGLGMELLKNPELTLAWANELTEGPGRSALLQHLAMTVAERDPLAGLALLAQVPEDERQRFSDAVYQTWGANDTAAALQQVDQIGDPIQRDSALKAVRQSAPVGIGAELRIEDGYPVINGLVSGTPAALSGQLRPGDRIVAVAQGDSAFTDVRGLPLADVVQKIRGAPGTALQLQVIAADAPFDSPPRNVSIIRDQLRFKK